MYPYDLFFGLDLYDLSIAVGFLGALLYFRIFADRQKFGAALQNLIIIGALAGIIGGYCSAVLFQAFYNYLEDGVFVIADNTGATFYGGLIGGAACFLLIYFAVGVPLQKHRDPRQPLLESDRNCRGQYCHRARLWTAGVPVCRLLSRQGDRRVVRGVQRLSQCQNRSHSAF